MLTPLPNSYWVVPGRVLAGEYPAAPEIAETRVRLARLLDAGVSCFVDLTQPDELAPYHASCRCGSSTCTSPSPITASRQIHGT